jgi:hypothetical protein
MNSSTGTASTRPSVAATSPGFSSLLFPEKGAAMNAVAQQPGDDTSSVHPFHVSFPAADLIIELRRRIQATRWPERKTVDNASQGVQLATTQAVARYWASEYDCWKIEAKLNALPQFVAETLASPSRRGVLLA